LIALIDKIMTTLYVYVLRLCGVTSILFDRKRVAVLFLATMS